MGYEYKKPEPNIPNFLKEFGLIRTKMYEIRAIQAKDQSYWAIRNLEIDNKGIGYHLYTYSNLQPEKSFYFTWEEFNKPISYFVELYKNGEELKKYEERMKDVQTVAKLTAELERLSNKTYE